MIDHTHTLICTLFTENAASLKSTEMQNTTSLVPRGTSSNSNFGLNEICTEEFGCCDLVDVGVFGFVWKMSFIHYVACQIGGLQPKRECCIYIHL